MNLRELKEIFRLVEKTDFTEVEIAQEDWKLRIERGKQPTVVTQPYPAFELRTQQTSPAAETPPAQVAESAAAEAPKVAVAAEKAGFVVTCPFVGTFYRAPSPGSPPYVEVGQTVKKGQTLCIVEAMKLMNELESDYDGRVAEIYVENAKPVEFGAKLFRIEPLR
ncbi:MAG: acetyl-CoA carboxylase biotin carboxyl carrier protein [Pseudomonadota bacterium]